LINEKKVWINLLYEYLRGDKNMLFIDELRYNKESKQEQSETNEERVLDFFSFKFEKMLRENSMIAARMNRNFVSGYLQRIDHYGIGECALLDVDVKITECPFSYRNIPLETFVEKMKDVLKQLGFVEYCVRIDQVMLYQPVSNKLFSKKSLMMKTGKYTDVIYLEYSW
jgi:hypothetical protein